jgi:hypothetical protein
LKLHVLPVAPSVHVHLTFHFDIYHIKPLIARLHISSPLKTRNTFNIHLLTASIVALALIVTAVGLSIGTHSPADGIRGTNPLPELDGLDFDIGKFANDPVWAQYVAKGDHLRCVMDATDAGAGFLIQDTRQPPSAASPWTGDLRRM